MDDKIHSLIVTSLSGTRYAYDITLGEFDTARSVIREKLRGNTMLLVEREDGKNVALLTSAIESFEDAE